jgi:hemoglobin-like flavoprotein
LFTDPEKEILRRSWGQIVPLADAWVDAFYKRLFELRPDYRTLFPLDMSGQKRKFVRLVAFVVKSLDFAEADWAESVDPREDLLLVLLALGRRHDEFHRIPENAYAPFGDALIQAFLQVLGEQLSLEAQTLWERLYSALALAMRLGQFSVNERADSVSPQEAQQLGEQAFYAQMAGSSSLEARLGLGPEPL